MNPAEWFAGKWFEIIQTGAVIFSLLATVHTIREDTRSKKVQNAIALTSNHRELWSMMLQNPRLKRVLNPKANIVKKPPTAEEELFVQMMILQLRTALKARETGLEFGDEDITSDVREIFALPIPKTIWLRTKLLHEENLRVFIEHSLIKKRESSVTNR